jgi:hypothetical protein
MTTIKEFIPHPNQVEESDNNPNEGLAVNDTASLIAYLCNLQPPMWTVLGGRRATGKTCVLNACTRWNVGAIKSHETLLVTLPDEEPKPHRRGEQASDLANTVFRKIYRASYEKTITVSRWFRGRQPNEGELSRQLSFDDVFGRVRARLNDQGIRRLILDNGHYLRHDPNAFQKLFDLQKTLPFSVVLLFGVRIEQDQQAELIFSMNMGKVNDAEATVVRPVVLLGLRNEDFVLVLQHVFFDLRGLPDKSFEEHEDSLIDEVWEATWKGNWARIELFAAHLDAELRIASEQPRTKERPGSITRDMVQRVIAKMRPRTSK